MSRLRRLLRTLPRAALQRLRPPEPFTGSGAYWESRYAAGGDSGDGSYRTLAAFKAEVLDAFVAEHGVRSVIEYGCGDGNQLALAHYPQYLGFDVSPQAVERCRARFADDPTKAFALLADYDGQHADLTLSLDVIYHLVEDEVFEEHMALLFDSADRFVGIYSSNEEDADDTPPHVRRRRFTDWIEANRPGWTLAEFLRNRYPYERDTRTGSQSDFFFYERVGAE
jgi:hypothetical protein